MKPYNEETIDTIIKRRKRRIHCSIRIFFLFLIVVLELCIILVGVVGFSISIDTRVSEAELLQFSNVTYDVIKNFTNLGLSYNFDRLGLVSTIIYTSNGENVDQFVSYWKYEDGTKKLFRRYKGLDSTENEIIGMCTGLVDSLGDCQAEMIEVPWDRNGSITHQAIHLFEPTFVPPYLFFCPGELCDIFFAYAHPYHTKKNDPNSYYGVIGVAFESLTLHEKLMEYTKHGVTIIVDLDTGYMLGASDPEIEVLENKLTDQVAQVKASEHPNDDIVKIMEFIGNQHGGPSSPSLSPSNHVTKSLGRFYLNYQRFEFSGANWLIVNFTPYIEYYTEVIIFGVVMFSVTTLSGLVSLFCSCVAVCMMTRPIRRLSHRMERAEDLDLGDDEKVGDKEEMFYGVLEEHFLMVEDDQSEESSVFNSKFMEDVRQMKEREKKERSKKREKKKRRKDQKKKKNKKNRKKNRKTAFESKMKKVKKFIARNFFCWRKDKKKKKRLKGVKISRVREIGTLQLQFNEITRYLKYYRSFLPSHIKESFFDQMYKLGEDDHLHLFNQSDGGSNHSSGTRSIALGFGIENEMRKKGKKNKKNKKNRKDEVDDDDHNIKNRVDLGRNPFSKSLAVLKDHLAHEGKSHSVSSGRSSMGKKNKKKNKSKGGKNNDSFSLSEGTLELMRDENGNKKQNSNDNDDDNEDDYSSCASSDVSSGLDVSEGTASTCQTTFYRFNEHLRPRFVTIVTLFWKEALYILHLEFLTVHMKLSSIIIKEMARFKGVLLKMKRDRFVIGFGVIRDNIRHVVNAAEFTTRVIKKAEKKIDANLYAGLVSGECTCGVLGGSIHKSFVVSGWAKSFSKDLARNARRRKKSLLINDKAFYKLNNIGYFWLCPVDFVIYQPYSDERIVRIYECKKKSDSSSSYSKQDSSFGVMKEGLRLVTELEFWERILVGSPEELLEIAKRDLVELDPKVVRVLRMMMKKNISPGKFVLKRLKIMNATFRRLENRSILKKYEDDNAVEEEEEAENVEVEVDEVENVENVEEEKSKKEEVVKMKVEKSKEKEEEEEECEGEEDAAADKED